MRGWWVPPTGLEPACAPAARVREVTREAFEAAVGAGRRLSLEPPPVPERERLLMPSNVASAALTMPVGFSMGAMSHQLAVSFLSNAADVRDSWPGLFLSQSRRELSVSLERPLPREGAVTVGLEVALLDVAAPLLLSGERGRVHVRATSSTDFHDIVIGGMHPSLGASAPTKPFSVAALGEEPRFWLVDVPVAWLSAESPSLTLQCLCLGIVGRYGANTWVASAGGRALNFSDPLAFVNIPVVNRFVCVAPASVAAGAAPRGGPSP